MKLNHATNERFHYNLEVKPEIKEVRFCLCVIGRCFRKDEERVRGIKFLLRNL